MTPAERLTASLAALPREYRARVLEMLELFDALTPKYRAEWLASARPTPPGARTGGELYEMGHAALRAARGEDAEARGRADWARAVKGSLHDDR